MSSLYFGLDVFSQFKVRVPEPELIDVTRRLKRYLFAKDIFSEVRARIQRRYKEAEKISFREKISFQRSGSTAGLPTVFL